MIPKMEADLSKLQNILIKNFEDFQSGVESFIGRNKELLNVYMEAVGSSEQQSVLQAYMDYMSGLFGMLVNTTDFIKDMMLKARKTGNMLSTDSENIEISSITSESTVTGNINGFSFVNDRPLPNECNNSSRSLNDACHEPNLPYGKVDTSNLRSGSIISKASVTSVNLDKLCFHICLQNSKDLNVLSKLYNAKNRTPYQCPPVAGIIFGMKIDGGIVRTIRCIPVSSGKVFLLDFGDIVEVEINLKNIFHLTREEKNIPAQAILCKLYCPKVKTQSEMCDERNRLKSIILFEQASFRVIENRGGMLYLEVLSDNSKEEQLSTTNNTSKPSIKNSHKEISSSTTDPNQLSFEELEMLYEEPPCTSNALMAVMGYVPKDDQRICRFYDPKIDGCFKGKNCRQIHVPLREDYITKDVVLSNAFAEPKVSTKVAIDYQPNEILKVKVTHITDLEYFYGIILNNSCNVEQMVFTDRDIRESDYLKRLPLVYDIVLAKFDSDGLWYRAQITDVDEYKKTTHVFYMDYGNRQIVPIRNLARCTELVAKIPPQAQQFRLADICKIPDSEGNKIRLRGMALLTDMLLEKELKLKVVSYFEDLVVRFLDTPYTEIPQLLADMHCVKLKNWLQV